MTDVCVRYGVGKSCSVLMFVSVSMCGAGKSCTVLMFVSVSMCGAGKSCTVCIVL